MLGTIDCPVIVACQRGIYHNRPHGCGIAQTALVQLFTRQLVHLQYHSP